MTDAIVHRGPDAEGFWESIPDAVGCGAMFGFRRLAILDLSPAGEQPMVDLESGCAIVFNGEIYNYVQLRAGLVEEGQVIRSTGDTAVLLRALALRGRHAVGELRGMFAFAFWDPKDRTLMLARDPLGIKPLYLARNPDPRGDWSLVFASELRAILASGLLGTPKLNPRAVASVVWNGFVVTPETVVRGVEPVWPGQFCVFNSGGAEVLRDFHWEPPRSGSFAPVDEAGLGVALEAGIRLHLASDVPLGVFLSGGVDSSAIANLAQRVSGVQVNTFTLAFGEGEFNEGPIARRVADAIGTRHHEVVLTEQHFVDRLDAALDSLDQPTFDGLNSYYMSHAVQQAGFKVALVGTGGDELFGGYTSFRELPKLMRVGGIARSIPPGLLDALARLVSSVLQPSRAPVPPQTRWAKLSHMIRGSDDVIRLYQLAYALFLPDFQKQLLDDAVQRPLADGLPDAMRARLEREASSRTSLESISLLEQRLFLGERLLRDTDAASMAASIEVRLPLVDQALFDTVNRLAPAERYEPLGKKAILRRIGLRGLDAALFDRPKSGFVLPFDRWLRKRLGNVMDRTMRDPDAARSVGLNPSAVRRLWQSFLDRAPGIYWTRVWAVYVLIRWCQRHGLRG